MKAIILCAVGVMMVGCGIPAEYKCPDGLMPVSYYRHNDHAMTGIGRQVEVHTSDLKCERYSPIEARQTVVPVTPVSHK